MESWYEMEREGKKKILKVYFVFSLFIDTHSRSFVIFKFVFFLFFCLNPAAGVEDLHIDGCFSQISLKSDPELQIHLLPV